MGTLVRQKVYEVVVVTRECWEVIADNEEDAIALAKSAGGDVVYAQQDVTGVVALDSRGEIYRVEY